MTTHHHVAYHHATIQSHNIFYREAASPANPTIVLLHGFPSSSHMFRDLIPQLAGDFHVIAPDYLGFGYSDAPSTTEFQYTFDSVTSLIEELLFSDLKLKSFSLYVQDYRASRFPDRLASSGGDRRHRRAKRQRVCGRHQRRV